MDLEEKRNVHNRGQNSGRCSTTKQEWQEHCRYLAQSCFFEERYLQFYFVMAKCGRCGWEGRKACSQWSSDPLWHSSKLTAGHQHVSWATKRFIFSCFYSLCNLNVFRVLNCWFKRWLYLDPWLVGILAPCSSRSCKSHLGMLHRWPLNIKQQVYDQNWGKSFFFYWSKPMSTISRNCFAKRIVAKVVATVSPRLLETSFMAKHLSDLSSLLVEIKDSIPKHEYAVPNNRNWFWLMKWFISWSYCRQKHPA